MCDEQTWVWAWSSVELAGYGALLGWGLAFYPDLVISEFLSRSPGIRVFYETNVLLWWLERLVLDLVWNLRFFGGGSEAGSSGFTVPKRGGEQATGRRVLWWLRFLATQVQMWGLVLLGALPLDDLRDYHSAMAYVAVAAFFLAEAIAIGRRGWVLGLGPAPDGADSSSLSFLPPLPHHHHRGCCCCAGSGSSRDQGRGPRRTRTRPRTSCCVWFVLGLNVLAWAGAALSAGLYARAGADSAAHALANATLLQAQDDRAQAHAEYGVFGMMVLASMFRWLDEVGPQPQRVGVA